MNQNQNKNNSVSPKKNSTYIILLVVVVLMTFILNGFYDLMSSFSKVEIGYNQFISLLEAGYIDEVVIDTDQLTLLLREDADFEAVKKIIFPDLSDEKRSRIKLLKDSALYTGRIEEDNELVSRLNSFGVYYYKPIERSSPILSFVVSWILPIVFFILIYYFFMRFMAKRMGGMDGGIMGVGKSKAKIYNLEKNTGVTFKDVAGQDEAKESLMEMVDFLHNPRKYQEIGARQPKGALLVGPPGTGKTLLAKAVAGEAHVPFFSITGSEFVEMFVGVGASRVRDLFEEAKKSSPCIIFIDEVDAIGKSRDNQFGSNDEKEQTLNQLLAEMDGFDSSKGIIVLAATNRPETLDQALMRPGRFDRHIIVDRPDLTGRESILRVHAKNVKTDENIDITEIAKATSGATGADLANIINEAALTAVKNDRKTVSQNDLMEAVETVIAGKEKKDRILSPKEKELVAYHEVGHALVTALQKNSSPVQKITIVPRTMGALGYTMNTPEEDRYLLTKSELLSQIRTLLGGRAAEIVKFSEMTTGASNDIERATKLARSIITEYGMSDSFGPMELEAKNNRYLGGGTTLTCSDKSASEIDAETSALLKECLKNAIKIIEDNYEAFERITKKLLEKENLTGSEFDALLKAAPTSGAFELQ